jgi:hypothetical protein
MKSPFAPNEILSSGTMRPEDLIPCFESALESAGIPFPTYEPAETDDGGVDQEEESWHLETLFDLLAEHAPEGCTFGANEGDGACYGFWTVG